MIRFFKATWIWFGIVGCESPAGGRFGPLYAWRVAWVIADIEPLQ